MLREWFKKNPNETLYGLDDSGNSVEIKKSNYEENDKATAIYKKLEKHWKANKSQWESNFFSQKPSDIETLDHTRFNFKDKTGWGQVIEEAYDKGYQSWLKNYDAYYKKQLTYDPTTAGDRASRWAQSWGFRNISELDATKDKKLQQNGDTYSSSEHYVSHSDKSKRDKLKDQMMALFLKHTALACSAFYMGGYRMELQESFIIEVLKIKTDPKKSLDKNALDEARRDASEDLRNSKLTSATQTPGAGAMSDEEIKNRQKFFKQCALMLNMEYFVQAHRFRINSEIANNKKHSIHAQKLGPYAGRFWMLEDPMVHCAI